MSEYVFKLDKEAENYARKELNETEETRDKAVENIRVWFSENSHLNGNTEYTSILAFLRGSKFNLERTKKKLENYYVMRSKVPEWFSNRDPTLPEIDELMKLGVFIPLRKFHENQLVVIIRIAAHDPSKHSQDNVFKTGKMVLDVAAKEYENAQIYGVTAIFDMTNVSAAHARQMTPGMIKKAVHAWQNYHCRPKQLEFIHAPFYVNIVLNIFKSFMSDKLKGRVRVHFSGLNTLHKVVDKDVLPVEYGGNDGYLQEHINIWEEKVAQYKDWFLNDEQFKAKTES